MGISAYKEITEWNNSEFVVPNHTYLFDGKSNILAYAKASNGEVMVLKRPLPVDTRRRKFEKVKHKELDALAKLFFVKEPVKSDNPQWQVKSDSGKTYTVEKIGAKFVCNCVGYQYRSTCKHSEQIRKENAN